MNFRNFLLAALVVPLAACAQGADAPADPSAAATTAATDAGTIPEGDPRIALAAKIPGVSPADLRATPLPGLYELVHGTEVSYVSADAKYVLSGDLFEVNDSGDFPNLSEVRRRELRAQKIAAVPDDQMLVFGPPSAKHTITVFTDIDCPWCQRMHAQVAEYNKLGIRVRYLFFPRTGPNTESWKKADAVWCAENRNEAFTQAKQGDKVKSAACGETPVAHDYNLGRELGVRGTPGVVLESGELVPGYLAPKQMLAHIEEAPAVPVAGGQ